MPWPPGDSAVLQAVKDSRISSVTGHTCCSLASTQRAAVGLLREQVWGLALPGPALFPPVASAGRGRDVEWGSLPCVTSFSVCP